MIRKQEGFTLVELMIAMVVFVLTIAAASHIFVTLLTQFKQQSKMTETQMEGIVGLETLRRDIEQAGYGLPWAIPTGATGVSYTEATASPASNASAYNDSTPNPPRAIIGGDGMMSNPVIGASDYLVIKSTIVGTGNATPKWSYIVGKGDGTANVKCWNASCDSPDDFALTDRVIALIPSRGQSEASQRILVNKGSTFSVQFGAGGATVALNFAPAMQYDKYLIYGVDSTENLQLPFNRADYYIATTGVTIPPRCAPGTGLLVKSVYRHNTGSLGPGIPLMDCVADMEIIYGLDVNNNGQMTYNPDITGLTAQQVRDQVKEVRVYILAHEGQRDPNYNAATQYPAGKVQVGKDTTVAGLGTDFSLTAITDWQRYRWKVYTMVVHAKNLL